MYLHNGSLPDLKFVFKTNCKFIIPIPKPLPLGKGLSVGLPPSPSKDACSQSLVSLHDAATPTTDDPHWGYAPNPIF